MPKKPFEGTEQKIGRLVTEAAQNEAARFEEEYYHLATFCESPIEELLLAALYADHRVYDFHVVFMSNSQPSDKHLRDEAVFIHQQANIGPYRVDFLFHDCSLPFDLREPRFMVVECDGHDFHERTKEQARRDKRRDRFFQSHGYKVLRFTGSEIFADPAAVAEEVFGELARDDAWRNRAK